MRTSLLLAQHQASRQDLSLWGGTVQAVRQMGGLHLSGGTLQGQQRCGQALFEIWRRAEYPCSARVGGG